MSEAEVATKAPESDAQIEEQKNPVIPGDTPAQTGPALGEHCTTDRPTRELRLELSAVSRPRKRTDESSQPRVCLPRVSFGSSEASTFT